MNTTPIKPCPFCGSDEVTFRDNSVWTGVRYYPLSYNLHHPCGKGFQSVLISIRAKTKEETIELWNKRV